MDNLRELAWFLGAAVSGVILAIAQDENHSVRKVLIRFGSGIFAAYFFTDPLLDLTGRDPETWRTATAAFLGATGYAITRFVANLDFEKVVTLVKAWRGK